ncbi:alpha/beta hydrolase fold domain-containing protein [Arthrobacter sp. StoSoilB13]|uniref:alpha/beta hydrolase n=1 Tax=Arthrobacter sp. StoSoilB13 TaxID=2830993 RepID=UPI001CC61A80|nr:alpha/beta hydrolase fold domain-containing protein [Arthrobacter sp. StoSoilB13]BCW48023.1 hypothetical protein StoSoilB13_03650 [Arthrobacter sp. StoSoilB13]
MSVQPSALGPLPPYDPEVAPFMASMAAYEDQAAALEAMIQQRELILGDDQITRNGMFTVHTKVIEGRKGRSVTLHVIGPAHQSARGAVVWLHSGGMVTGAALSLDLPQILDIAEDQSLLVVAVEYGRAPDHPAPAGMLDSLDAFLWVAAHANELNYPRNALFLHGLSGGAGLAAAVAFEARAAGLDYAGLVIDGAMIDDRAGSISYQQLDNSSTAVAEMYRVMWNAVLGKASPSILDDYPHLAVGRLLDGDFSGFPPVFLMCGASDAFRDDTTALAQAIWRSGGTADLHQWAGTIHGSDLMVPEAHVSKESAAVRRGWYDRRMRSIIEDIRLSADEKIQAN